MHPHLRALADQQHGVFTTAQARAAGYSTAEIRSRSDSGRWVRLRRGVLTERSTADGLDLRGRHLLAGAAALVQGTRPAYLSHRTAALAWRIPLIGSPPTAPALTVEHQHRRAAPDLELHMAVMPAHHRAQAHRLPVTSPARTVSDLARSLPFGEAVVAADGGLHAGLCTSSEVAQVVRDCPTWPGIARTKRVLEFADGRAESPGESLSRVAFAAAGLPMPDQQVELLLSGQHVRVDFMWVEHGLVGEFDGRIKYARPEDLWREKQREDLIRRHGYRVVRWIWADLYPRSEVMIRRVVAALEARR